MLEWKIGTQREAIKLERKRLEQVVSTKLSLKSGMSKWITDWLSKTDEELMQTNTKKKTCCNCGEYVDRWIETDFSFCDEYDCGIAFCEDCAKEIANKFNNM